MILATLNPGDNYETRGFHMLFLGEEEVPLP
jgi:hypothetical protein